MKLLILSIIVVLGVQSESEGFYYDIEEFTALRHIDRVLICLNKDASQQIMPNRLKILSLFPDMNIEFLEVEECLDQVKGDKDGEKTILAVITPKPFKGLSYTDVPIYFYEAPHFLEELEAYSNVVTAVKNWRPLKHAFTHFFKQQDWIRIAIISDDSPYSAAFEDDLVGHLNEQQLVYNVQRCVHISRYQKSCNFNEAFKFIKENRALIVIANVDVNNAQALVMAARAHGVTSQNKFVWISRDWPFNHEYEWELSKLGPVYSLTLAPMLREAVSCQFQSQIPDGPHLASILQGLSLLEDAVKIIERERIDYFYRDVADYMNAVIINETYDTQAFIRKIDVNVIDSSTVITVVAVNDRVITSYSDYKDFGPTMLDVEECNIMRSDYFMEPCNDFWIIAIVIVVLLFVLLFFLIIYISNRYLLYYFEHEQNKRKRN